MRLKSSCEKEQLCVLALLKGSVMFRLASVLFAFQARLPTTA
jgi:hypoxanthine-guanine phosphoribosyltransferase